MTTHSNDAPRNLEAPISPSVLTPEKNPKQDLTLDSVTPPHSTQTLIPETIEFPDLEGQTTPTAPSVAQQKLPQNQFPSYDDHKEPLTATQAPSLAPQQLLYLARAAVDQGQLEQAQHYYTQMLQQYPSAELLNEIASQLYRVGDYERAQLAWVEALTFLRYEGRYPEAQQLLRYLAQLTPQTYQNILQQYPHLIMVPSASSAQSPLHPSYSPIH
ncbi:MAG: hypothetical protein JXR44_04195 [Thiotrichales bacterium]|nr:hypothetical protein [Thiotrichales bacterium]